ncbi:MAG: antibiotic biosynthesis monooxygenase [Gammaproteobacteria bacterium]|nr:antibiotic biosynthesis monooxygenase [Gammaproteobacteria bacterium]
MSDRVVRQVVLEACGDPEAARAALAELVGHTRQEPGALLFAVHEFAEQPGRFVLWEDFVDRTAFDAHMAKDYTRAFFARRIVQPVSGEDLTPLVQAPLRKPAYRSDRTGSRDQV